MTAAKKMPASRAGFGGANSSNSLYKLNIPQNSASVKPDVPLWMADKVALVAAKLDVWALEQEEVAILDTTIRAFAELAERLPIAFRNKVKAQKPREMEPLERAAVILCAYDWRDVVDVFAGTTLEEKATAHFDALVLALREGGES